MYLKLLVSALLGLSLVGCVVAPDHGSNRGYGHGHVDRGHAVNRHPGNGPKHWKNNHKNKKYHDRRDNRDSRHWQHDRKDRH